MLQNAYFSPASSVVAHHDQRLFAKITKSPNHLFSDFFPGGTVYVSGGLRQYYLSSMVKAKSVFDGFPTEINGDV